jgi:biotin carboxyl carrier protein
MRYFVTVGEKTYDIDVNGDRVTVDGEAMDVELLQVAGTPLRRLSVNGESHRVVAERSAARGEWDLHVDGFHLTAEVVDERTRAIRTMTARSDGPKGLKPIKAPMPGMIMRIDVNVGDKVKAGQGVVIIEAMKMENELKAEAAGTVSKVAVSPGTAVEKGTVLIEFAVDG